VNADLTPEQLYEEIEVKKQKLETLFAEYMLERIDGIITRIS